MLHGPKDGVEWWSLEHCGDSGKWLIASSNSAATTTATATEELVVAWSSQARTFGRVN